MKKIIKKIYILLRLFYYNINKRSVHISSTINSSTQIDIYSKIYRGTSFQNGVLGSYSYIGWDCILDNVEIARFSSVAPGVIVIYGRHPVSNFVSTSPIFYSSQSQCGYKWLDKDYFSENKLVKNRSAIIGSDVWIGQNVSLIEGITIGDGAIVGAGAVVSKDVLPYEVVAGVPARHVKFRYDKYTRDSLVKLKWWDMDLEFIKNNKHQFVKDPSCFIKWLREKNDST